MRKILCAMLGLLFAIPSFANCNLLPVYNTSPKTVHGVTFTPQPDGSIIINGSVNDDSEYANYIVANSANNLVLPAGTYTISGTTGGSSSTYILDLYGGYTSGNGNSDFFDTRAGDPIRRTATSEWRLGMYAIRIMRGYTANNLVVRPMIERGDTATAYTPYDATCIERCKNLFDGQIEQGGIQFADGRTTSQAIYLYSVNPIPVTPNTSYVLSADTNIIKKGEIYFYKNNGEYIGHINTLQTLPRTFTTPENAYQVKFILTGSGEDLQPSDATNVQLEQGSTATAYVPYVAACHKIQVASTKYVETQFSDLGTRLAAAVATVNTVVSNTITQAASIATLQSGKQTRPADDTCPAYKQCLLVEDEQGVPHWYQITDPFRDFVAPIIANNVAPTSTTEQPGYTQLEYIESTGTQYIDTGIAENTVTNLEIEFETTSSSNTGFIFVNGTSQVGIMDSRYSLSTPGRYTITESKNGSGVWVVHNVTTGTSFVNMSPATENRIALFNLMNGDGNVGQFYCKYLKIYYFKAYNGDTLVQHLVPAKQNSDGAIGMYDTVSKTFFTNAGTGTFTAGPVVANTDVPTNGTWSWTWTANASNGVAAGTLSGIAICNNVSADTNAIATSAQMASANWTTSGQKCWCTRTGVDTDGSYTAITDNHSVLRVDYGNGGCVQDCADNCARGNTNASFSTRMIAL